MDATWIIDCPPPTSLTHRHTPRGLSHQDWTREEIQAVYDLPFVELLYRAATVRSVCAV